MVQLNLTSVSGKLVGSSARANILHYRSDLHRALRTVAFSPLLLTEYAHEQQRLSTELFSAYLVQEVGGVTGLVAGGGRRGEVLL